MAWFGEDVVEALFPAVCRHCGLVLPVPRHASGWGDPYPDLGDGSLRRVVAARWSLPLRLLCGACASTLVPPSAPGSLPGTAIPCVTAFGPVPALFDLVHAFKYEACIELAPWFATALARAATARLPGSLVLVPVPMHPERRRERGFDPSALLAQAVARLLGAPVASHALLRVRPTRPQAQLDHVARAANVDGAFARTARLEPRGATIVLVDDIVTTGATAHAALAALAAAGPTAVLALAQARQDGPVVPPWPAPAGL